jgi:hypothetical protein
LKIKKTNTFFIISNFNTDPEIYLKYCSDYHIYDQSTEAAIKDILRNKYKKISFVKNTGHNISDYFRFFVDHYENLPSRMMLLKGNIIGRHLTQEYFDHVYNNQLYTFLSNTAEPRDCKDFAYYLYDGALLELNVPWYVSSRTNKYFATYNELLAFIFDQPIFPKWILFSPGACYIVSRDQVKKHPKVFYENLLKILDYTYFPAEAYMVERMMHVIFSANYNLNSYMNDKFLFDDALHKQKILNQSALAHKNTLRGKMDSLMVKVKNRYNFYVKKLIIT